VLRLSLIGSVSPKKPKDNPGSDSPGTPFPVRARAGSSGNVGFGPAAPTMFSVTPLSATSSEDSPVKTVTF
jgi:hypothetical protein